MNEYELDGDRLVPREHPFGENETIDREFRAQKQQSLAWAGALSVEQMLSAARSRLQRLSPDQVFEAALRTEAILVDIRPEGQREIEGSIEGALVVERNVLEWRFDPASEARLPVATHHNIQVILFCSEGYTSSLAAAALQDLGLWRATDMIGGFQAWKKNGLRIPSPIKTSKACGVSLSS
jgi:rhodanese-related sulfurtransferase